MDNQQDAINNKGRLEPSFTQQSKQIAGLALSLHTITSQLKTTDYNTWERAVRPIAEALSEITFQFERQLRNRDVQDYERQGVRNQGRERLRDLEERRERLDREIREVQTVG